MSPMRLLTDATEIGLGGSASLGTGRRGGGRRASLVRGADDVRHRHSSGVYGRSTARAPLGTWDVVCRDDTWCSVPADVRAAPCPAIQVCRIGAYTALRTGPDEVRIVRADGGSACMRVPDVLDIGAQDDTHLVVLHGRGPYALGIVALAALAYDATPAPRDADWAHTVPCVWDDGAPSRLAVRGRTCVVLGDDAQTLAYAAWVE